MMNLSCAYIWYVLPAIPILSRLWMCVRFSKHMGEELQEAEKAPQTHRSVIIPMAGFSFAALLAIALADAKLGLDLHVATYYLLLSFMSFYFSMSIQSYKYKRWHDIIGNTTLEVASLTLFLAIINILLSKAESEMNLYLSFFVAIVWSIDHVIRYRILWRYLSAKEQTDE
jgi:hypothetical protein